MASAHTCIPFGKHNPSASAHIRLSERAELPNGKGESRQSQSQLGRQRRPRATAAEGQILDIQYADLVADPIATVQAIYDHHGYDFTEAFEVAMRQWLDDNRQHKHGAHRYTLEEYGLNEDAVREVLDFE